MNNQMTDDQNQQPILATEEELDAVFGKKEKPGVKVEKPKSEMENTLDQLFK